VPPPARPSFPGPADVVAGGPGASRADVVAGGPAARVGVGEPVPFLAPRADAYGASRWEPDLPLRPRPAEGTRTFSSALLSGLGGEAVADAPPPGARGRAVVAARGWAARVAALRGDERTAMLAVGGVVGLVLLLLAGFVLVARLTGGPSTPAAAAAPSPTAAAAPTGAGQPTPTPTEEPTPTGSPLPPSSGAFVARHSNLCLAAPAGRTDPGAQLVQRGCGTDFGTAFLLVARDQPDTYALVNENSSRCADVYGASTDDAAPVVQWDCNGGPNQTFQLRPLTDATGAPTGYVQLVALHSGKCLDVTGLGTAEGTPIQQFACRDPASEAAAGNQSWRFAPG
jgi:hypothetical protein